MEQGMLQFMHILLNVLHELVRLLVLFLLLLSSFVVLFLDWYTP